MVCEMRYLHNPCPFEGEWYYLILIVHVQVLSSCRSRLGICLARFSSVVHDTCPWCKHLNSAGLTLRILKFEQWFLRRCLDEQTPMLLTLRHFSEQGSRHILPLEHVETLSRYQARIIESSIIISMIDWNIGCAGTSFFCGCRGPTELNC